jgi:hypothetical protein
MSRSTAQVYQEQANSYLVQLTRVGGEIRELSKDFEATQAAYTRARNNARRATAGSAEQAAELREVNRLFAIQEDLAQQLTSLRSREDQLESSYRAALEDVQRVSQGESIRAPVNNPPVVAQTDPYANQSDALANDPRTGAVPPLPTLTPQPIPPSADPQAAQSVAQIISNSPIARSSQSNPAILQQAPDVSPQAALSYGGINVPSNVSAANTVGPSSTVLTPAAVISANQFNQATNANILGTITPPQPVPQTTPTAQDPTVAQIIGNSPIAQSARSGPPVSDPTLPPTFATEYNPGTGSYRVVNNQTGEIVSSGLTEAQASVNAKILNNQNNGYPTGNIATPSASSINRQPGAADNPYGGLPGTGAGTVVDGFTGSTPTNGSVGVQVGAEQARSQEALQAQQRFVNNGDWRFRVSLAPGAAYLYKLPDGQRGILDPLYYTDGVIYPYTPQVNTVYSANYTPYELTHSNYKGYWYKNSNTQEIQITGTFTAQDTQEANYLLAVIHFYRSVTKMFYGQDELRGMPPPLVYLTGFGMYQFNAHPCVVSQFQYNLPDGVDYIRAGSRNIDGTNLIQERQRQTVPKNTISNVINRLKTAGLPKGGFRTIPPAPPTLGLDRPTYVPTKMQITITCLPIQTRQQVSNQFSLTGFANGDLQRGGFW